MAPSGCSDSVCMDQNSSVWEQGLIAAVVYGDGTSLGALAMVLCEGQVFGSGDGGVTLGRGQAGYVLGA